MAYPLPALLPNSVAAVTQLNTDCKPIYLSVDLKTQDNGNYNRVFKLFSLPIVGDSPCDNECANTRMS